MAGAGQADDRDECEEAEEVTSRGLGTPRSGSGQGMTLLLSNSSSPRSHKSESSDKSGTEINEIETSLARTYETVKTSSNLENEN